MKRAGLFLLVVSVITTARGQEGTVREIDKNFLAAAAEDRWIYNDLDRGMALARSANRPLMVVIRCIP